MRIEIENMNDEQKQALVCMYYATLPKTDERYKNRMKDWSVLEKRFGKKKNTYKNAKDAFDPYFSENGRVGWKDGRALGARGAAYQKVYDMYASCSTDDLEQATRKIIQEYRNEEVVFVSMKCGFPQVVHRILANEKKIVIDGIYTLKEELTAGKVLFVTLGGDVGRTEVDWTPGFAGIAHVVREPYDFGYNGKDKYFKLDIEMDCVFERTFKREDFLSYRDAYDAPYIGPELSRDPSQALSSLDTVKAVAVIRTVLDEMPDLLDEFREIFSADFMERVLGAVTMMIPVPVQYGEDRTEVVNTVHEEMDMEEIFEKNGEIPHKPYAEPRYYTGYDRRSAETGRIYSRNRIVFGAPGTGKSFKLNREQSDLISEGGKCERVTFHPDYAYSHFVGTYKPVPTKEGISYEYVPGPFMRTYVNAIRSGRSENPKDVKPYLLLIEEINRANAASVFGEVFQLLDRDDRNKSQYPVRPSEDMKAYLAKELGGNPDDYEELIIPDNMYIWATMNSADQGVFPMDTAFKRRWEFEYIGIDSNEEKIERMFLVCPGYKVSWNELRKAINDTLLSPSFRINEDKLIGPFFVAQTVSEDADKFREVFKSKVMMYLFEDAAKQRRNLLFEGCDEKIRAKYSAVCNEFDRRGIDIFCKEIRDSVKRQAIENSAVEGTNH